MMLQNLKKQNYKSKIQIHFRIPEVQSGELKQTTTVKRLLFERYTLLSDLACVAR